MVAPPSDLRFAALTAGFVRITRKSAEAVLPRSREPAVSIAAFAKLARLAACVRAAAVCGAGCVLVGFGDVPGAVHAGSASMGRHTFYLDGGFFYGPGPIVPDTQLPHGRLSNIRFDPQAFRGFCEFANDGSPAARLSDKRTRINQNIDAGRLLIGGGTSPVLLTAVDGGPHRGTEQYYLDDQYRFVWRVDIALDPGFAEGIIRLDDFVLSTGVVRIGPSLQSQAGQPGGYDQAGTLDAGEYLAGRVGDFDEDGYLDGVLVAAPNVPLHADMLPGAPVGNRRGFRTDVPISPRLSAELMLRGALHLRAAVAATLDERAMASAAALMRDFKQRISIATSRARAAAAEGSWRQAASTAQTTRLLEQLERLRADIAAMSELLDATTPPDARVRPQALPGTAGQDLTRQQQALRSSGGDELVLQAQRLFERLQVVIADVALLNSRSGHALPTPAQAAAGPSSR